jgi:hypothetical protein
MQENKKNYYQQATYKEKFPMFPQPSTMFFFQEIDCFNAILTTTSTYNEPLKSVSNRLKARECKHTKLRELPSVPNVPTKDEVQEVVT